MNKVEINIARDGIKNSDEVTALIYFGRYEVKSWSELYFAAVKTLYIEYPEAINSLVSRDCKRDLYLRTTTIDMQEPARIATILYLDLKRQPEEIVRALREIFYRAGVVNINMSIEIKRGSSMRFYNNDLTNIIKPTSKIEIAEPQGIILKPPEILLKPQFVSAANVSAPPPVKNTTDLLEVPSFMKSNIKTTSIIEISEKDKYVEIMKSLAKKYPKRLKNEAGKYIINRRVTLAESSYRYFKTAMAIGSGLSIELAFTDDELIQIANHYLNLFFK